MAQSETSRPSKLVVRETTDAMLSKFRIPRSAPEVRTVPPRASIKHLMSPVRDQGAAGTCTTFCVVALLESFLFQGTDLSEANLTHEAEKQFGNCTAGLALAEGITWLNQRGIVHEQFWPYRDTEICWSNPPDVSSRLRLKLTVVRSLWNWRRADIYHEMAHGNLSIPPTVRNLPLIQWSLTAPHPLTRPVAVAVPVVDPTWYSELGDVQMPDRKMLDDFLNLKPEDQGWHCVPICGFDDATRRCEFKNSWGTEWGQAGFGTIPYDYIERYSDTGMDGSYFPFESNDEVGRAPA
jgi:hypothetical protein